MSRKSNDASRHGPGPSGAVPRHATSHSADATDELSRRPVEPEGSGDGARRPGAACREGMAASRRGMGGPRERGFCARGGLLLVPEGRWGVATGGASRRDAEPVDGTRACGFCPAGAEGSSPTRHGRTGADGAFLRPCRGGLDAHDALHGLRIAQSGDAPPVATGRDPSGVERRGDVRAMGNAARAIGARARAGGVHAFAGEVPEGRPPHTPLWHQRTGGSEVRRG